MDWRNACRKLQEKGLKFEFEKHGECIARKCDFTAKIECYRISAQPTPDRENWQEWCRKLDDCGVKFECYCGNDVWINHGFPDTTFRYNIDTWRIPYQPIPTGIEKYLEEEMHEEETTATVSALKINHNQDKPEIPEIPHREQQIQWHEDMLHHLRTGEPMTVWEFRFKAAKEKSGWIKFGSSEIPAWDDGEEYRRKPRTVTYWHCVVIYTTGVPHVKGTAESRDALERVLKIYDQKKVSPITETTVELED